jgi:hypothetical protein
MPMHFRQGKIAKDEAHAVITFAPQFIENRIGGAAIGALIVTVLDDGYRRRHWPTDVITGTDG